MQSCVALVLAIVSCKWSQSMMKEGQFVSIVQCRATTFVTKFVAPYFEPASNWRYQVKEMQAPQAHYPPSGSLASICSLC
ncbi:hypothetical protein DFJ43DRAFT_117202 [Lentinula guzmanii]|uniref:Uncharacterized protein n=1 Tax=Lentinula guzmanii TaxID=2804957 RepID=A0AA38J688_9AGAR|nr:hypothetical protein DFJ43DRAFT_117202 [Lentinula guzmanii]